MKKQGKPGFKGNRDEQFATDTRRKRKMTPPAKMKYRNPKYFLDEDEDDQELNLYDYDDEDLT